MPASSLVSVARRSILPTTCLLLGVAAYLTGERVLVDMAAMPTIGSLPASTVSILVAAAFGVLFVTTLAMNFFSKEAPVTTEPILHDLDEDLVRALDELDAAPSAPRRGKHAADVSTADTEQAERLTGIISALRHAAAASADAKAAMEVDLAQARADLAATQSQLAEASQRAATAEETEPVDVNALAAQIREEVQREALASIQDLSESSDRLVTSLKDALARAEEQIEQTRQQAANDRADLLAAHAAEVAAVREQSTAGEYERIKIAILALNRTHADVLDPMQREAVERHQQRIIDAFDALDAEHRHVVLPSVPMPKLSAEVPVVDIEATGGADAADDADTSGEGSGWLSRRRKRR